MNSEIKKPNFFIVGAPKCGTTSLHYYLNQHPEIFMSEPKELLYFCKDFHEESRKFHREIKKNFFTVTDEKSYLDIFKHVKNEKIIGESSPIYYISKVAHYEIYKFNPESKIVVMVREPVDLLYSIWYFKHFNGVEPIGDFKEALNMESYRKKGKYLPKTTPFPSFLFYTEYIKLAKYIKNYLKVFGEDNVKVLLFDDLKNNPKHLYKEVLEFLGVNTEFLPNFKNYNPTPTYRFKILHEFMSNYYNGRSIKRIMNFILPKNIKERSFQILWNLNVKPGKKPPLDTEFKHELMIKFKPEVEKLSDLLGRDLITLWGYDKL